MNANTFYYTLSTIPQVVSAIAALIGVFSIFRAQSLERLLIGHGQSALNRWGSPGYGFPETTVDRRQRLRLQDAVGRGSVEEVGAVLASLRDGETRQGRNLDTNPGGLTDLYERRFRETHRTAKDLRRQTRVLALLSLSSILIAVVGLAFADAVLRSTGSVAVLVVAANTALFMCVVASAFRLAWLGLSEHPGGRRNEGYDDGILE